jgi:hypothetical protein
VGVLIVDKVSISESTLTLQEAWSSFNSLSNAPIPALLTRPGQPHLRLYIAPKDVNARSCVETLALSHTVFVMSDLSTAHVSLSTDENSGTNFCFEVVDGDLHDIQFDCKYLVEKDTTDLTNILMGLSHY